MINSADLESAKAKVEAARLEQDAAGEGMRKARARMEKASKDLMAAERALIGLLQETLEAQ